MKLVRFFNPVGAHPRGLIGEDPRGIPNNLMPYIRQVTAGRRKEMLVYGNDYPHKEAAEFIYRVTHCCREIFSAILNGWTGSQKISPSILTGSTGLPCPIDVDGKAPHNRALWDYIFTCRIWPLVNSAALNKVFNSDVGYYMADNLGTGHGTSVLEMVVAFERACWKKINVRIAVDAQELPVRCVALSKRRRPSWAAQPKTM